jgi:transposase-like protein
MTRRQWDSKTKAKIVLEGLSGKPISELCSQNQISQNQYYQWRDRFLAESYRAFEGKADGAEVFRLKAKNQRLQQIVGALTVELKKTEDEL